MKRYGLAARAKEDLEQIKKFLTKRAGPEMTRRVLTDFRSTLDFLGNNPGIGHTREDLTARPVKFWPVYSYLIVYDPATNPIQILRVLHATRDIARTLN